MDIENQNDVETSIKYFQNYGGKYKIRNYHSQDFVEDTHKTILLMKQNGYITEIGGDYVLTERGLKFENFATDKLFEDEERAQKENEKLLIKSTLKTNRIQNRTSIFSIIIAAIALVFSIYQFFLSQESTKEIQDLKSQIIKLKKQ